MPFLSIAFLLGIAAGLRTFTAPAVLWLMRYPGPWAIGLGVVALLEYAADLHPKTPPRTATTGLLARVISGGFVGWIVGLSTGNSGMAGAIAGVIGAGIGAYAGLALRVRAIGVIGNVPAGIAEDAMAIALAILVVSRLP
jgi:uncharacterized membrane protein